MKKALLFWGLILSLTVNCFSIPAAAETPLLYEDLQYEIRDYGVAITAYVGNGPDICIPAYIDGKPVVSIAPCGKKDYVKRIVLPETIRIIDDFAFQEMPALEIVEVSNDSALEGTAVSDISGVLGQGAFYGCSALKSVELPDGIIEIRENAFNDCSKLERVRLPKDLERIGDFVFRDCKALQDIWLPDSLTWIGALGFAGCFSLRTVHIPPNLRLGHGVFIDFATYQPLDITFLLHPFTDGAALIQANERPYRLLTEETACGIFAGVESSDGDALEGFQAQSVLPAYISEARQALNAEGIGSESLSAVYSAAFMGDVKPQTDITLLLPVEDSAQPAAVYRLEPDGTLFPVIGQLLGRYMVCTPVSEGIYLILQGTRTLGDLDADDSVSVADVMEACKVIARNTAGQISADEELLRGDLDGDGEITIADVMEICKILARKG